MHYIFACWCHADRRAARDPHCHSMDRAPSVTLMIETPKTSRTIPQCAARVPPTGIRKTEPYVLRLHNKQAPWQCHKCSTICIRNESTLTPQQRGHLPPHPCKMRVPKCVLYRGPSPASLHALTHGGCAVPVTNNSCYCRRPSQLSATTAVLSNFHEKPGGNTHKVQNKAGISLPMPAYTRIQVRAVAWSLAALPYMRSLTQSGFTVPMIVTRAFAGRHRSCPHMKCA